MDTNGDNMINFRDFVEGLGIMCRAELTERLKLLFRLHQPPALLPTDKDDTSDMSRSGTHTHGISVIRIINMQCIQCTRKSS